MCTALSVVLSVLSLPRASGGYRTQNPADSENRNLPPIGHKQQHNAAQTTNRQKPYGTNISFGGPGVYSHYKMAQQPPAPASFRNGPPGPNALAAAAVRHGGIAAPSHHPPPYQAGAMKPPQFGERKGWGYSAAGAPSKYVSPYSQRYLTKDGKAQ